MSLKDNIIEKFRDEVEKQNPWQPYRGEAGGEGWQNMITGEIRYQEQRPGAQEGMPEEYDEDQIPEPEGEIPDELEGPEPPAPEEIAEYLEEGDEVSINGEDYEILTVGETMVDAKPVGGSMMDVQGFKIEDIDEHPAELQPVEGWAEGWAEPPDDHEELYSDQTVEIYDKVEGVYKEGEIEQIDEWAEGQYVSVRTEDGDIYEFLDGEPTGSGEGSLLTAVEDLIFPDVEILQPGDFNNDLLGDGVIFNERTGDIVEGEVTNVSADMNSFEFETENDGKYIVDLNSEWELVSEEGMKELELHRAETIDAEELIPENAIELAEFHEGALAEIEHPAEGSVTGEVRVIDHGEKGRHLYVGDSEVGIPLDDPDHPLAQVEIGDVESQWYDVEQSDTGVGLGAVEGPVDLGSEIFYGDETYQITGVDPTTGELELESGEFTWSADEAATLADYAKPVEMPEDPYDAAWEESLPDKLKPKDTVALLTEDGTIEADEVVQDYADGTIETEEHGQISEEQIRAWANTGKPVANQVDPGEISSGTAVTIAEAQSDGSVETFEAYVTEADTYGTPMITAIDAEGNVGYYELDEQNYGIVDHDPYADAENVIESVGDWREYDSEEMASDFYDQVVDGAYHDNYLSKRLIKGETPAIWWFFKQKQEEIRTQFMQYFPPDDVEDFYEAISSWKVSSNRTGQKPMLEEAFRQAMGSQARVGGEHEERPAGPMPSQSWVKMAEVANTMSQWYYEDVVMPNTGGQLTRDCVETSLRSFMLEWAENPDADEFGFDGRALNNFQISPGKWKHWRVTPSTVEPENIGLMADMMFNPMETNAHEDEIWVNPDGLTVAPDQVGVGPDRTNLSTDGHFGGDISDWSENQVRTVSQEIAQQYENLTIDDKEVYRPDELSDTQVETFLQVAERAEEIGVNEGGVQNWMDLVQAEAVERGITAPSGADDHPILESAEQLPEGTEVTMREHTGETFPGLVIGHENGQLEVENADTGHSGLFDLDALESVEWAGERYGKPSQVDMTDFDVQEGFDPLDEVYVWSGGDWQEGKIMEVDESGMVEVSVDNQYGGTDYFDEYDVQNENYVVPQDMVNDMGDYPEPGEYVEIEVPDSVDYDANSIMAEVDSVDPDGSLNVGYDQVPWLEHTGEEHLADTVNVDPGQYEAASEPSDVDLVDEYGGNFSEGTKVPIDDDFGFPNSEVAIGDSVEMWDDAEGVVVDITPDHKPKIYIEDPGGKGAYEAGDVETFYPSDDVQPTSAPDDFGAITNGFDDIDQASAYEGDPVEYINSDGEIVEGEMTATFPSMDAVHIDGEEDPVHFEHVRPAEPQNEGIGHDDLGLGSKVVVEHFDPGIGTTEGTIIGFNEDKKDYIVDLSDGSSKPAPSELFYVGTHEVQDIKGEGEVNEAAVEVVSGNDGFTQDLPGSGPEFAVGDPVDTDDFTNLNAGDWIMVDVSGQGDWEPAEVQGGMKNEIGVEYSDGSTGEIQSTTALDIRHAVEPDAEGSDEVSVDDIDTGDQVETVYTTVGYEDPVQVLDVDPENQQIQITPNNGGSPQWVGTSVIEDVAEGSDDVDWEVGQEVTLDNGLDPDHPDAVNDEFGTITETIEMGGETFYAVDDPSGVRIGEYSAEELEELAGGSDGEDEGDDDFTSIPPEAVHEAGVSQGEEFTTTIPGEGETSVTVTEVSADPAYPVTVEAEDGSAYLIWDDGEVEPV